MKYEVTVEDNRSGQVSTALLEVPPGESVAHAFLASPHSDAGVDYNLLDVRPVGEEDGPLPRDPDFPERPTHPDFARLSAAGKATDERAELPGTPPQKIGVDEKSLLYAVSNRVGAALQARAVQTMPVTVLMKGAWIDGFAVGIEYQNRGGSRPTNTGSTGEKESSR